MSAVVAEHVTRSFGSLVAVDDISLAVDRGQVVGLVGANGAGKTTLIRVILGLLAPDAGSILLAGGPPSRRTRERVGYVPQGLGLWPDLTVAEHLQLVRAVYAAGVDRLDDEGVTAVGSRLVGHLSLGLRRRTAFALAMAHRTDVLILDEPTSGVDPLARARLWEMIRGAASAGAGVLVSTHYLDEAAHCDQIVLLADGRVAASGSFDQLVTDRTVVQVVAAHWETAWTLLEEAGLPLLPAGRALRIPGVDPARVQEVLAGLDAEVSTVPASLEEVFLTVTAG